MWDMVTRGAFEAIARGGGSNVLALLLQNPV